MQIYKAVPIGDAILHTDNGDGTFNGTLDRIKWLPDGSPTNQALFQKVVVRDKAEEYKTLYLYLYLLD